jgi:GH25 family lysozyme M1 (1,4-beta-N-acetylmuramidase)
MLKGIDVSKHQSVIDWDKVKPHIDFAILRCGYGNDITSQDDVQFKKNAAECERLNIPFAVYIYSYAKSETMIDSEVAHALRTIGNCKPFCVYFDMEENATAALGKAILTAFAKRFCEAVKAKGFKVGVYANQYWFTNYLDVAALHKSGYSIWCAKYSDSKPNIAAPYDIWQYTSSGRVDGVNGNVDMNYMYNDIRNIAPAKKSNEEIAAEVIAGKWGNGEDRKNKLTAAGYDYKAIQACVNKLLTPAKKSNKEIAAEVVKGLWGNGAERKKRLTEAGYNYSTIQRLVNQLLK